MARGEMSGDNVFRNMKYDNGKYKWGGSHTSGVDGEGYTDGIPDDWCYPDKGRQGKDNAKKKQALVTPTGTPEYVNRLSLRGNYCFTEKLEGTLQPSYVIIFNRHNVLDKTEQCIEIAAALTYKF